MCVLGTLCHTTPNEPLPYTNQLIMKASFNKSLSSPVEKIPFETLQISRDRRRSSASEITMDIGAAIRGPHRATYAGTGTKNESVKKSMLKKANSILVSKTTWRERKKKKEETMNKKADEGSSADEQIVLHRDLSRRKRNSHLRRSLGHNQASVTDLSTTNVTAYLSARVEAEKPVVADVYHHSSAICKALFKPHMLDIRLKGTDGINVPANSFILSCYSPLLEEVFFKTKKLPLYDEKKKKLRIDFCNSSVLKAAVHHCFTGELPPSFEVSETSEEIARNLAQLDRFATTFQMRALGEISYGVARKLINRRAVLACAVFDELSCLDGAAGVDSIKRYALDTIREMPMDTLLNGGVQWMDEKSLECIIQDNHMDVDEFYMYKILNSWEKDADRVENRLPKARKMAESIELKFIAAELIKSHITESGYFGKETIAAAIRAIEDTLDSRDPQEMERVIVEGAGLQHVNGIYVRVLDEMGMSEEEILFVKEADDGISDVGLYLYGEKWNIAMCTDYSHCFYTCPDNPVKDVSELVPRNGWSPSYEAAEPAPACTYLPNTRALRSSQTTFLAPNLEEMIDPTIAKKRRSDFLDGSKGDTVEKRTMTLEEMMNLPEDREHNLLSPNEREESTTSLHKSDSSIKYDHE